MNRAYVYAGTQQGSDRQLQHTQDSWPGWHHEPLQMQHTGAPRGQTLSSSPLLAKVAEDLPAPAARLARKACHL
jgi:hypothetical protein